MEYNPQRSWAVTYTKMWNLCMCEPLARFNGGGHTTSKFIAAKSGMVQQQQGGGASVHRKKSDYCWSFNKGVTCKFGKKCKFLERCSYCDLHQHGVAACPKLEWKESPVTKLAAAAAAGGSK